MEEDFEWWYGQEYPRVWAACAALAGDVHLAGDATDEAFVRALERWPSVAAMASPGGWVQVVALNQLRRVLRRQRRERLAPVGPTTRGDRDGPALPDPDLWAAVAALPRRQRTVVVLRYVHDLPEAEIGQVLGISRGTVASTLASAQANLRRALAEPVVGHESDTKETLHG